MNVHVSAAGAAGTGAAARPLIWADDLAIRFGETEAVAGLTLAIGRGEFVSLLGPSGCGKSSLLRAIAGLVPLAAGTLSVGGAAAAEPGLTLGLMFQKPLLLPWRTTLQNVTLPVEIALRATSVGAFERGRAMHYLEMTGLAEFAAAYPHQLSGGMQQRAALARTLVGDPDILLLDEPFGALDEFTRELLNEQLLGIWHSGMTRLKAIVMVTHSVPEAVALSDRIAVLSRRPARLLEIIDVGLRHPRDPGQPEFARLVGRVRTAARPQQ